MAVTVRTPASSANLGPGFDALALGLALYDNITVENGVGGFRLTVSGEGRGKLDKQPEKNLARRAAITLYSKIKVEIPQIHIHMDNAIPLSRGLGSSAAAIVGALVAVNVFSDANLSKDTLFEMAVELEGHADNVAAALYGGLVITYKDENGFKVKQARSAANIGTALLVPEAGLSTAEARAVLPKRISREQAVFNIGRAALLVEALIVGDLDAVPAAVEDALHQPWRRGLIPDYNITEHACYQAGAKGVALSGAGPTLIAFYDKRGENRFKNNLAVELDAVSIQRRVLFLDVDTKGSQVIT